MKGATSVTLFCPAVAVVCLPTFAQRVHEGESTPFGPEYSVLVRSQTEIIRQNAADTYASRRWVSEFADSPNANGISYPLSVFVILLGNRWTRFLWTATMTPSQSASRSPILDGDTF